MKTIREILEVRRDRKGVVLPAGQRYGRRELSELPAGTADREIPEAIPAPRAIRTSSRLCTPPELLFDPTSCPEPFSERVNPHVRAQLLP
ncbi:hypothetical protein ACFYPT_35860 [Streptomyces sp. NPDC005529]